MKNRLSIKSLLVLVCMLMASTGIFAQTVVKPQGNTLVQVQADKPTSEAELIKSAEKTQMQYQTSDGTVYPVYKSKQGALFVVRKSKTGNFYKQYLKVEQEGGK